MINKSLFFNLVFINSIFCACSTDDRMGILILSIKIFLVDPTLICLFGIDKNQVTQIAAKIRKLRKPSAYKGKGIRLINEKILLKQGKKK